jgi:RND family efflux transporter MFP subunit
MRNGTSPIAGGLPAPRDASLPKPPDFPKKKPSKGRNLLLTALVGGGAALALFFSYRHSPRSEEAGAPVPIAPIALVKREDLSKDIKFDAEFRPYQNVDVHAKVAGYVKEITVDIGDHVKAGQVLATLEIPELKDDLRKAGASTLSAQQDVLRTQADYDDAHVNFTRLTQVVQAHPNLIAQQDIDTAQARDLAAQASLQGAKNNVEAAQANESKMLALLGYCLITAPFDGIVTKRYADTGALVQAGTASEVQAMPVVTLAQDNLLRLDFPVQESVVPLIRVGQSVKVTVDALGETFPAKITRFTGKVDMATRTMITEVEVPNDQLHYKPGMYTSVRLVTGDAKNALSVPVQALTGSDGKEVLVLDKDHVIEQRQVKIGIQTADRVEILEGLQEGEMVLVAKGSQFRAGEKATPKTVNE